MLTELQLEQAAFDLWIGSKGTEDLAELEWVKCVLPMILEECCTEKKSTYIMHYFAGRMSMQEIAERYGVNKSTVSRTIRAGLDKAYSYLRFCCPLFMKAPKRRGYLRRGGDRT